MHSTTLAPPLRARTRFAAALGAALLATAGALTLLLGPAAPAQAHDELVGTSVETNANDGTAQGVTLHYNNEIMDVGAEILATGPDGASASVADGIPKISGRDVTQDLLTPLTKGEYRIAWRVVSSDGHPISGELFLQVEADGTATLDTVSSLTDTQGNGDTSGAEENSEPSADDTEESAGSADSSEGDGTLAVPATDDQASNDNTGMVTTIIVVIVAVVVIGAAAAVLVGSNRRKRAIAAAVQQAQREQSEHQGGDSTAASSGEKN